MIRSGRSFARVPLFALPWLVAALVVVGFPAPAGAQPPSGLSPVAGEQTELSQITPTPIPPPLSLAEITAPSQPPVFMLPPPRAGLPSRIAIPTIGLNAAVERVGLLPDNSPGTPQDYANTAWFEGSARPGEVGNAVINGHVDSTRGPAVFFNLPKLKANDYVYVTGDDGVERTFVVRGVERYGPYDAPLERIFGPRTDGTFLNLITCDNATAFDRRTASYTGYVTVYTELLAP